jgi:hypothetical protein
MTSPAENPPTTHQEAVDIVENDDALRAAGIADEDAATDDDARTADAAPVGDTKDD